MNYIEYKSVCNLSYTQYCDYLQKKYGIGLSDYMTKGFNKNQKCTRTKDGLIAHHKMENQASNLSKPEEAMKHPFEWQKAQNIVYADYLEHLLLHVMICRDNIRTVKDMSIGLPGVVSYLVPELNDLYSGKKATEPWRAKCYSLVENDRDVYLAIMQQFIQWAKPSICIPLRVLQQSLNEAYGIWSSKQNVKIYKEIEKIYNNS